MKNNEELYSTKDLGIAAFLDCKGFKLKNAKKEGPIMYFKFQDNEKNDLSDNVLNYLNGNDDDCLVSAPKLVSSERKMKQIIYNMGNINKNEN